MFILTFFLILGNHFLPCTPRFRRALSTPPCAPRFRFAPSRSRASPYTDKNRNSRLGMQASPSDCSCFYPCTALLQMHICISHKAFVYFSGTFSALSDGFDDERLSGMHVACCKHFICARRKFTGVCLDIGSTV